MQATQLSDALPRDSGGEDQTDPQLRRICSSVRMNGSHQRLTRCATRMNFPIKKCSAWCR